MERAWDINSGSTSSVIVAVIDSGVAFSTQTIQVDTVAFRIGGRLFPSLGRISVPFAAAPDLEGVDRFVAPWDFVWSDDNPVDMDGHGTHVAGTIGQSTDNRLGAAGMAFNVRLMPLKVLAGVWDLAFGQVSRCCGSNDADVAAAISYAASHGAKIINISVGGTMPSPAIEAALRAAVSAGCFVVLSAGNDYLNGNPVSYPAAYAAAIDGVVAVGAVKPKPRAGAVFGDGSSRRTRRAGRQSVARWSQRRHRATNGRCESGADIRTRARRIHRAAI